MSPEPGPAERTFQGDLRMVRLAARSDFLLFPSTYMSFKVLIHSTKSDRREIYTGKRPTIVCEKSVRYHKSEKFA